MGIDAPFADGLLVVASLVWIGFLLWLVLLTRSFNRTLAWIFLVLGFACPPALLYASMQGTAASCLEAVINTGHTPDAIYQYEIVRRVCQNTRGHEFQVRMGRAGTLEPLHTVYESDHYSKPLSVTRRGRHEFSILLETRGQRGPVTTQPIIIRMDPNTGLPETRYSYRWRASNI